MLRRTSIHHDVTKINRPVARRYYSVPHTLPFKVDRRTANKIFIEKKSFLEPGMGKTCAISISIADPVKECFIPVHAAGINNVVSDFVCKYGIDRTEYHTIWVYNAATKTTIPTIVPVTVTD